MYDPYLTPDGLGKIKSGERPARSAEAAHGSGLVLTGSEQERLANARPYRPRVLYGKLKTFWPRGEYAAARIKRIMEGCAKSVLMTGAVAGAEYPGLAKEWVETWFYHMTRSRPAPLQGADHNPFRHLSDIDAERLLIRRIEDICDRSTGKLGHWYTR